jgi:RNA 2',3'-cyclic 3'-phosphodiesterase
MPMADSSRSASVRAFIAAEISAETRAALGDLIARLKRTEAGVSWSRPGSIHLTLRFLGDIESDQVDEAAAAMTEAVTGLAPIAVEVGGWGTFPENRRPRVIWVGLRKGAPELATVFVRLETALAAHGFGPADKPFSPHLTLGRVKSGHGLSLALKIMETAGDQSFGAFPVDRLILLRSELNRSGAIYTKLREAPLG